MDIISILDYSTSQLIYCMNAVISMDIVSSILVLSTPCNVMMVRIKDEQLNCMERAQTLQG